MVTVRVLVATAGVCAAGCTQVHQLGQIDSRAEGATTTFEGSSDDSSETVGTSADSLSSTETDTDESSGDETSETGETGETPEPCAVVDLGGEEGITLEIEPMSQWDKGACHLFHLTNETPEDVIWTRDLRFGGTLEANYWNAEVEQLGPTDWRFRGSVSAGNIVILSGETLTPFGACMLCTPTGI